MKIVWTPKAEQDRAAIWGYFVGRDPTAPFRVDQLFSEAAASLAEFPLQGHSGTVAGTLELISIGAIASFMRSWAARCEFWL